MTVHTLHRAAAVALAVLCSSVVALAGTAYAHIELDRSEPAAGAVLDASPAEVFLRFTDDVEEGSFTIRVVGPDGNPVTAGETQSGGRAAAVNLARLTDDGVYRVRYRGVAADGHPVEGRLRFRVQLPEVDAVTPPAEPSDAPSVTPTQTAATTTAAQTPAPLSRQPTTVPWWPFALLLGIAALVGVMLFRRR